MKDEVIVGKSGRITLPVWLRKKYKIEEGARLRVIETEDGILLKVVKSAGHMAS